LNDSSAELDVGNFRACKAGKKRFFKGSFILMPKN